MATRTIADAGGAWNTDATWVEGAKPTAADDVVATATSGDVTIDAAAACRSIDLTGYVGILTHAASVILSIGDATDPPGNNALVFPASGWTYTLGSATTSTIAFASTSATALNINPGGKTFGNISFTGAGGSWKLTAHIAGGTTATVTFTRGTFDGNGFDVTYGLFASNTSQTRTIIVGSGAWSFTGNNTTVFSITTVTNLTLVRGSPFRLTYSGSDGTRTITITSNTTENQSPDITVTAGTDTITNGSSNKFHDLIFDGFAGTLSNNSRTIYGDFIITSNSSGMTLSGGSQTTTMGATSGTKTLTTDGKTLDFIIGINGQGGTFQLGDDLTLDSARSLVVTAGIFSPGSRNIEVGTFSSNGSQVRSVLMGSGTWTLTRSAATVWNTATATNLTLDPGTAPVVLTGTTQTLNGSPTFYSLTKIVAAADTLTFTDSTTTTVTNSLTLTGSAGQLLTLQGSGAAGWTLAVPATQSISYVSVSRSTATVNTADASDGTSVDGGNNVNWDFGSSVDGTSGATPFGWEIGKAFKIGW